MRNYIFLLLFFFAGCGGSNDPAFVQPPANEQPPYTGETCMSSIAMLMGMGGTPGIIVDAADFDGTNDYMTRGAGLTGAADSKSGIVSFWYRIDGGDGAQRYLMSADSGIVIQQFTDNKIYVDTTNSALSSIMSMNTSAIVASATWRHILASWDLSTASLNLYVNDVSDKTVVTNINDTIDYTTTNFSIGAAFNGTFKTNGCLAEFYFAPGQYLDFSNENNRRKFISALGKPVHLGTNGSLPTGTAPIVYQHIDDGEAVANFATNRGTGGNLTITGTLDTATTSPSD